MTTTLQDNYKNRIAEHEKKLLAAFTHKDLDALEAMIHPDALFVLPNGKTVTKAMIIDNYRKGDTAMAVVIPSDQIISIMEDTAVVSVNLELHGNYHDTLINSQFRYIRVWKLFQDSWKVTATCGVPLNNQ